MIASDLWIRLTAAKRDKYSTYSIQEETGMFSKVEE
jgi:hypothetical protein